MRARVRGINAEEKRVKGANNTNAGCRGRPKTTENKIDHHWPHLMRLQVDDVRKAWLLVKVEHDSNLVQI